MIIIIITTPILLIITNFSYGGRSQDCLIKALLSFYLYQKLKHKRINREPIYQIIHSFPPAATNLSAALNIWTMWARSEPSLVISESPYNLEVDLLLKLVGREVCHMFSIHKYWLWLFSCPLLTLVGFHFGTNLYEMCPIWPQSLSCVARTCST